MATLVTTSSSFTTDVAEVPDNTIVTDVALSEQLSDHPGSASQIEFLTTSGADSRAASDGLATSQVSPDARSGLNGQGLLTQFRSIDGSGNNLRTSRYNPTAGSAEVRLVTRANYAPGTDNGLIAGPNPRTISNVVSSGAQAEAHDSVLSGWSYVFGQFVDHDLDLTNQDGTNSISIPVPAGDPFRPNVSNIPLSRSLVDPGNGRMINAVSGWLDASQVYGSDAATAASLRLPDGHMKTSRGDNLPIVNGQFVAGDVRVMENPELTGITLLFVREHNYQVDRLAALHPGWTGDQLYQTAKAITTAEFQNIVYSEFLPSLLGRNALSAWDGYNSTVDPRIMQEFSVAAFRFGHSTVSGDQTKIDNRGNELASQSLADSFVNTTAKDEENGGLDALLRNLGADPAQANDVYAVDELRNLLVAPPDVIDLIAIDIQRERDAGLGTLNQTRAALGLRPYNSFSQITSDPVVAANLRQVYGSVDKLDLFIGGLAENHVSGSVLGSTFRAIIAKQFEALRDGDRFWWQNQGFDRQTQTMIANTTLSDLIMRDTDTTEMQQRAFVATERRSSDVAAEDPSKPQLVIGVDSANATIAGGSAADTIVAGKGLNQSLTGGGGADLFIFGGTTAHVARITDFDPQADKIEFHMDAAELLPASIRDALGGAQLTMGDNKITLLGVRASQVQQSNLIFMDTTSETTSLNLRSL